VSRANGTTVRHDAGVRKFKASKTATRIYTEFDAIVRIVFTQTVIDNDQNI